MLSEFLIHRPWALPWMLPLHLEMAIYCVCRTVQQHVNGQSWVLKGKATPALRLPG